MDQVDQIEEGWQQIKAGLALVQWSKLTQWDADRLALVAADENVFESNKGHRAIHDTFGRLICWIAFSTGAEYLAKGLCFLEGQDLSREVDVIRIPSPGEDIDMWVQAVNATPRPPCSQEKSVSFGTLRGLPLKAALQGVPECPLVLATFELLRSTIRNRDAHRYAENKRAFHFHVVETLFVPAFNIILRHLKQTELRARVSAAWNL